MQKLVKILIVDDDLKLRNLLKKYLQEQNFEAADVRNTSEADKIMQNNLFDAMILDMMMPGENGLDYCKRLRVQGNSIPIIMLSAQGDDVDKIIGLELGMDDYLSKPFNPRELVARIKAVLRRAQLQNQKPIPLESYTIGHYEFDLVKRQLTHIESQEVQLLTSTEYDLLKVLVENANIPLSRDKIMRLIHAKEFNIFDRSIDVLISRLRKLIEEDVTQPKLIKTVWGVGYVFVADS